MITEEINIEDKKEYEIFKIEECLLDGLTIRQTSISIYGDVSKEHIDLITNILKTMRSNRRISKKLVYSSFAFEYETQKKVLNNLNASISDEHYNPKNGKYENPSELLYKLERINRLNRELNINILELIKWADTEPELIDEFKKDDIVNISI